MRRDGQGSAGKPPVQVDERKKNIDNGGYGVRVRYMFDKMLCPRIPAGHKGLGLRKVLKKVLKKALKKNFTYSKKDSKK